MSKPRVGEMYARDSTDGVEICTVFHIDNGIVSATILHSGDGLKSTVKSFGAAWRHVKAGGRIGLPAGLGAVENAKARVK